VCVYVCLCVSVDISAAVNSVLYDQIFPEHEHTYFADLVQGDGALYAYVHVYVYLYLYVHAYG
jgi:hypothetical protein